MPSEIKAITTPFMLNVSVNCYLVKTDDAFALIDTGRASKRRIIEQAIEDAGCQPGNLKLIILTHGDFDHCGNAAYLRQKFGAKIVMHPDDCGIVERGDMTWNRHKPNIVMRTLMGLLIRLKPSDRFTPDFTIQEGDNLRDYGFDAQVIELPGHSRGSIGLLTSDGDLFCGDLLSNTKRPEIWSIVDDRVAMDASADKLNQFEIDTVYPGHGRPFPMDVFRSHRQSNQ